MYLGIDTQIPNNRVRRPVVLLTYATGMNPRQPGFDRLQGTFSLAFAAGGP